LLTSHSPFAAAKTKVHLPSDFAKDAVQSVDDAIRQAREKIAVEQSLH
jgi:hypothetical protein